VTDKGAALVQFGRPNAEWGGGSGTASQSMYLFDMGGARVRTRKARRVYSRGASARVAKILRTRKSQT
jgi:hypothetical protein